MWVTRLTDESALSLLIGLLLSLFSAMIKISVIQLSAMAIVNFCRLRAPKRVRVASHKSSTFKVGLMKHLPTRTGRLRNATDSAGNYDRQQQQQQQQQQPRSNKSNCSNSSVRWFFSLMATRWRDYCQNARIDGLIRNAHWTHFNLIAIDLAIYLVI